VQGALGGVEEDGAQTVLPDADVGRHQGDQRVGGEQGIAYVPYFPLGGFTPLQSSALSAVAARLEASPLAVALAWLLQRSPNMLLIPGTSSVAHLRENVAGAGLALSPEDVAELDAIGG
jgi:diketogulonate reductase-like aldo/keto reductase